MKIKLIALLSVVLLTVTTTLSANPIMRHKLKVVASNTIIADWVQNIAGNRVDIITLVPPNTDIHFFVPTPKDVAALTHANIVFEFGLDLEFWLLPIYKSANTKARLFSLNNNLKLIHALHEHHHDHNHSDHHHHGEYDPHTWLDVQNAITMVQSISQTLIELNPENTSFYKENTSKYLHDLQHLDAWIIDQVSQIPQDRRILITNHSSFHYFAKRYGFKVAGSVFGSIRTENIDPSASHFIYLVEEIKKKKIPAVFSENIQNPTLARELAREAGLPEPKTLYNDALSNLRGPANSYTNLMRYDVTTIVNSLR